MRTFRAFMIATAIGAAVPALAVAQRGRGFDDAWFWGLKTGGFSLADSGGHYVQAPVVGLEWLITRTYGGLYVSGSQTFFNQHSFVLRDPATRDSGFRAVSLENLRRLDVALMGFPGVHLKVHPYVGAGFTMDQIAEASPQPPFFTQQQLDFANRTIEQERVGFTPFFIGGAQVRLKYCSVFGQLTLNPAQKNFILYNGRPWNVGYELGLRYNIGSAIEKDQ